jgi:hypothetical protein
MARAAINNANVVRTGTGVALPSETTGDPVNNHFVNNDGNVIIVVRNSNGTATARTLTVHLSGAVDGQSITPRTYSIAAGATRVIGPFPTGSYGTTMQVDVDNAELLLYTLRIPR